MSTVTSNSHESSHIWLCDEQGDVHVLRDLEMYTKSTRPNLHVSTKKTLTTEEAPPPPPPSPVWSTQGHGFRTVVAGHMGIVCGIKGLNLYIRLGVTHDNPLGESWGNLCCKASQVVVGSSLVVRRTQSGGFFMFDMSTIDLTERKSLFVLNWCLIPQCPLELWDVKEDCEPVTFMTLDKYDNLFLIDSAGRVCFYSSFGSRQTGWSKLCASPSIGKGVLNWLAFWREDEPECHLSNVSSGKECVWCVDLSPNKLWHLVLSYSRSQTLKANWTKVDFPIDFENEEVIGFCADKCEVAGVLCAVKIEEELVLKYYPLNSKTEEIDPLVLTGHFSTCASISICRTMITSTPSRPLSNQNPIRNSTASTSQATPTSLTTPTQLAKSMNTSRGYADACCENGDCYYCQQAANQPSVSIMLEDSQLLTMTSRKRGVASYEGTPPSKRPRIMPATYSLLEGIHVTSEEVIFFVCIQ